MQIRLTALQRNLLPVYSLYEIESKVFRDGKRWTVIYDSNKNEIRNVKDLPVGQVIIIPLTVPKSDSFKRDI